MPYGCFENPAALCLTRNSWSTIDDAYCVIWVALFTLRLACSIIRSHFQRLVSLLRDLVEPGFTFKSQASSFRALIRVTA